MKHSEFSLDQFDYPLPDGRIAAFPAEPRDSSFLLVYDGKNIIHGNRYAQMAEILSHVFPQPPLLVFNDTRVFKARLIAPGKGRKPVEIFLLHPVEGDFTTALARPSEAVWQAWIGRPSRWLSGMPLILENEHLTVRIFKEKDDRVRLVWEPGYLSLLDVLEKVGRVPLPPYIKREAQPQDSIQYQTTYARETGSVAAPTAGLHFTPALLERLEQAGIPRRFVTLHVGAGTFAPVRATDDIRRHLMHPECFSVSRDCLQFLSTWQGPVLPVGTTSLRTLESLYWLGLFYEATGQMLGQLPQELPYEKPWSQATLSFKEALGALIHFCEKNHQQNLSGDTSLYIYPTYKIRSADGLITNFHQPRSTLLMLVQAFIGEAWRQVYAEALDGPIPYRFLSYGDGMLLVNPQKSP
ncbi:MAG: S-adenosylmethionine:tRNA ribosyltransferase-isomerase [Flavobacteriales bacterium]|nr:S-adenosylmethionine:tRNA ribosyltransferase-isomerase [Flavobacteriales bacterium]MCX7649902.1 S-adenosylmethionine:tRNA ribosyltransferase-isomerase [Flavobacteriales bacterium]MDW8432957.1 S-adenosylmethionine:tRNA ribosyltransferase-isomerase [Flavobacteriales bacterium]